jgi:hypothetical protein
VLNGNVGSQRDLRLKVGGQKSPPGRGRGDDNDGWSAPGWASQDDNGHGYEYRFRDRLIAGPNTESDLLPSETNTLTI